MPLTWVTMLVVISAEPKSDILMSVSPCKQDVGRLDVAVDHPGAIGEIQGPGAFENDLDDFVQRQQGVRVGSAARACRRRRIPSPRS